MTELAFRDGIMDQIRLREQRFDERAYLFVLSALEHSQTKLTERRHITGPELAFACRDLALQRFGVMAKVVLDHWGMRSTMDIGDIVFTLVDLGRAITARSSLLLIADPELVLAGQRVEHIAGKVFERIFDAPIGTVPPAGPR